jgi:hypothetical protein
MDQQVTCKIAFVSFGSACSARMASLVGTVSKCPLATSGLLLDPVHHGKGTVGPGPHHQAPAVPGDVLLDRQRGVAEGIAEGFDDFFLRLRTRPRAITTSCS